MDLYLTTIPPSHQDAAPEGQVVTSPLDDRPTGNEKISKDAIHSEAIRPPSLRHEDGVKTPAMRRRARVQFATLCWSIFVVGWNDGTLGPLLPRLQEFYHVSIRLPLFQVKLTTSLVICRLDTLLYLSSSSPTAWYCCHHDTGIHCDD